MMHNNNTTELNCLMKDASNEQNNAIVAHRTDQLDDLDQDPVVGGGGHQLEKERCQRQVVSWVLARQLTDHVYCSRLYACGKKNPTQTIT
jgi:hypothetical protein